MTVIKKVLAPLLPYAAVGIGLLVLHNAWIAVLAYHFGMILVLLYTDGRYSLRRVSSRTANSRKISCDTNSDEIASSRFHRDLAKTCLSGNNNVKLLILMAVLGAAGGPVLFALWPLLGIPSYITLFLMDIGITAASWPFFLAYFILVNPWLEECYWRGYLGSDSRRLTLNDLWFSGYHILVLAGNIAVVWLITVFVVLTLAAWLWRQVDRQHQGLTPSVISHLTADMGVMLTIYFMT